MPARKNRPDKYGGARHAQRQPNSKLDDGVRQLALKLILAEKKEPKKDHYVGWPDMHIAEEMERRGLLREGVLAKGCFYLTDKFRETFYEEMH